MHLKKGDENIRKEQLSKGGVISEIYIVIILIVGNISEVASFVIAEGPDSVRPNREEINVDAGMKIRCIPPK